MFPYVAILATGITSPRHSQFANAQEYDTYTEQRVAKASAWSCRVRRPLYHALLFSFKCTGPSSDMPEQP